MTTNTAVRAPFRANFGASHSRPEPSSNRLRLVESTRAASNDILPWMQNADLAQGSRLGKGGAFALTLLAHVMFFALLANLRSDPIERPIPPTQVVIVAEQQDRLDLPEPPKPQIELPQFDVPLVPVVIDAFNPDSNAITVAERPSEATPANVSSTGVPREVSAVEYVREPKAKVPAAAKALKQRGTVLLRALVDVDGRVRDVQVFRSSGHKLLDDAARSAMLDALFKPYTEDGRSLPVYVRVPIEFGAKG